MIKTRNLNLLLFYMFMIGLFLAHTVLSYSLIIPAYFLLFIKIFLIDKKLYFPKFFIIIIGLFIINIIFQLIVNFSPNTIFYSFIILLSIIVYSSVSLLDINSKYLGYLAFFTAIIFLLHPQILNRSVQFKSYFLNPNSLAGAYFFLFFIIELTASKKLRLINSFILLPIFVITIASRGLFLAFMVYYTALFLKKLKLQNIFAVFVIFILILFFLLYVFPKDNFLMVLLDKLDLEHITVFGSNIVYGAHREQLWRAAVLNNPSKIFGIGFGNSNAFIIKILNRNWSPHNTFINLYLEGGYLFVFTYIFSTIMFYIKAKTSIAKSFIIAVNVRMFFESGFPFGISLQSALLFLPFFIDQMVYYAKKNDISYSESNSNKPQ